MSTDQRHEAEFTAFARARMPHLYRAAWLLCGDRHRAEDLVQETLGKVYAHWGPKIANPAAYAQTTLTRTWISQQRRASTHERPTDELPEQAQHTADDALRLTLLAALDGHAAKDRAVVVLHYLDDATIADVARQVGSSEGAVRKRLMRARRVLRERLGLSFADLVPERTES
ncbi:RNA polymerase sigma factor [Pimelobacter simplex]|uniref:RNA polymerase sigma factor n=1 Tax=Nocardioides simplex TaxID=2045 RepID=UPI00214FA1B6|nr:RNA polymerase sigma factor [Pimelobacter simplex]UUW91956.1 RNA polymerase sigma factor [Pimelobacter simplex]UUW95783.1 RNA polymerase sigma factor [Pimelobacter simplex]